MVILAINHPKMWLFWPEIRVFYRGFWPEIRVFYRGFWPEIGSKTGYLARNRVKNRVIWPKPGYLAKKTVYLAKNRVFGQKPVYGYRVQEPDCVYAWCWVPIPLGTRVHREHCRAHHGTLPYTLAWPKCLANRAVLTRG